VRPNRLRLYIELFLFIFKTGTGVGGEELKHPECDLEPMSAAKELIVSQALR